MEKKRKKILYLVQLPPPIHGVSTINQRIINSSRISSEFETIVIPIRLSQSIDDIDNFSVQKVIISLNIACKLFYQCLINRPDLVYFTISPIGNTFFRDLLFVLIIKLHRIKVVFHLHRIGVLESGKYWLRDKLYKWVFSGAYVIHLTPRLYDDIQPYVNRESCYFVSNGIDDPLGGCTDVITEKKLNNELVNISFLSHVVIEKGPIVLMDALAELKQRGLLFQARFAGGRMSSECKRLFEEKIYEYDLVDNVEYIGPVYGDDKDLFYKNTDIFVFPTLYDAFGLVLLEAMSYGIPVVATEQGGIPDIVVDEGTGFLVKKNDHLSLADKLEILVKNGVIRSLMGKKGREYFEKNYTMDVFEKNILDVLRQCVYGNVTNVAN